MVRALAIAGAMALVSSASAAVIVSGQYRLRNHPDGNARPPAYGAKFTELYNATSGTDVFTFDFDHAQSAMYLDYMFGNTIRIHGQAWGGRDTGTTYANDQYRGLYTFDFTYVRGVGLAAGDDDLFVAPLPYYNYGTLLTPLGDVIRLRDGHYGGGQPDFRFGDADDDRGHRGFNGLSGWGWLYYARPGESYTYVADSDWLFTGELVPAPGAAAALIGLGALAARRRRA